MAEPNPVPESRLFARVSEFVTRRWGYVIGFWVVLAVISYRFAPAWDSVTLDGDFAYLPASMASVAGERLQELAFPESRTKSRVVFIVARDDAKLTAADVHVAYDLSRRLQNLLAVALVGAAEREFNSNGERRVSAERELELLQRAEARLTEAIQLDEKISQFYDSLRGEDVAGGETAMTPPARLAIAWHNRALVRRMLGDAEGSAADARASLELDATLAEREGFLPSEAKELPLVDLWTRRHEAFGRAMLAEDRQAELLVVHLASEFMAVENLDLVTRLEEELIEVRKWAEEQGPAGLELEMSGSAAVGRDILRGARDSIRYTELFTLVLVLSILLAVYRAPVMALVPLFTLAVAQVVSLGVVAALTQVHLLPGMDWWQFKVFKTTKIFIVVILFGGGTDYCLFLIARYREELRRTAEQKAALRAALAAVGDALAASALTTILGLAMMAFADFGKFRYSGPTIGLCLAITLFACITLAPALLTAFGRGVFWPSRPERPPSRFAQNMWQKVARAIVTRPGAILVASLVVMAFPAWYGWQTADHVTYDLLSELSPDQPSRRGAELHQRHFPIGDSGPIVVLAHRPGAEFLEDDGKLSFTELGAISDLTLDLRNVAGVHSVRSLAEPLGDYPRRLSPFSSAGLRKLTLQNHRVTKSIFLAHDRQVPVTRLEVVLDYDPFSLQAVEVLNVIDRRLHRLASEGDSYWNGATFAYIGTTAAIRDLRQVTTSDYTRIQILVVVAVFAVLWVILRRTLVCLYMILTVLVSFFVTIGLTEAFFAWAYGGDFYGLDWKVPLFLFVILVAIGEDYNVYLATRVFEEQARLGPFAGLREAIVQTGGIITSCGLIMAGTFLSMTSGVWALWLASWWPPAEALAPQGGVLRAVVELGFALSLGVMLDTFVIRPVLLPAFLALLCRWEEGMRWRQPWN